ncbi:MAG: tetratricopeptide repeat protein [Proteobacteria bacterium]|nr:tetratricopeptide repeat protein [Pseudomonadota bacterium]
MMMRHACFAIGLCIGLAGCAAAPPGVPRPLPDTTPESEVRIDPAIETAPREETPHAPPWQQALLEAMASGNVAGIEAEANAIIDARPTSPEAAFAFNALAQLALDQGNPNKARLYVERALAIADQAPQTHLLFGQIAHAQKRDSEALEAFARASQAAPDDPRPDAMAAAIYLEYLDLERALTFAGEAYRRQPADCRAIDTYADALYANRQYQQAIEIYETRQRQKTPCPPLESVLKNMAKIYEVHVQNSEAACKLYEALLSLSPDNPSYLASRNYQCH